MNIKQKDRTRKLIQLGGIVHIAGIDNLETPMLLGLLLESNQVYNKLSEDKKKALFAKGFNALKNRKKSHRPTVKKIPQTNKFYEKETFEKWLIL